MDYLELQEEDAPLESFAFKKVKAKANQAPRKKRQVLPPPPQEEEEEDDEEHNGRSSDDEEDDDDGFIDRSPLVEEPQPSKKKKQRVAQVTTTTISAPPPPAPQEIVAVSKVRADASVQIPKKPGRTTSPKPIMIERYPQYQNEYLFCKYLCEPVRSNVSNLGIY